LPTNGIRRQQLADSGAQREEITTQFSLIRAESADLWRRATAGWWRQ
jgi:hypothetical protein